MAQRHAANTVTIPAAKNTQTTGWFYGIASHTTFRPTSFSQTLSSNNINIIIDSNCLIPLLFCKMHIAWGFCVTAHRASNFMKNPQ
jgi:hypothetical protein